MASEVYSTEVILLMDETEVELRPLPISKLRKFMRMWSEHINEITKKFEENESKEDDERDFTEADLTDAQFDVFIKMCALGLESQVKGERTEKQYLAYLEEVLNEKIIHRVLERTGGLKLGDNQDPNTPAPVQNLLGAGQN